MGGSIDDNFSISALIVTQAPRFLAAVGRHRVLFGIRDPSIGILRSAHPIYRLVNVLSRIEYTPIHTQATAAGVSSSPRDIMPVQGVLYPRLALDAKQMICNLSTIAGCWNLPEWRVYTYVSAW